MKDFTHKILLFFLFLLLCLPLGIISARNQYYNLLAYLPFHTTSFTDFLHLTVNQFASGVGSMDMGSYIKAAQFFNLHGYFPEWTLKTWPLGQPALLAVIFKVFGENHYPLTMLIFTVVFWSITLVFVYRSLEGVTNPLLKILLAMTPLYFVTIRNYVFGPEIFMSEAIAVPLFIIALCFFIAWLQQRKMFNLIIMAVLLGCAGYFRGYFETFGNFIIGIYLLIALVLLIMSYIKSKLNFPDLSLPQRILRLRNQKLIFNKTMQAIALALVVFICALLPGRVYNYIHLRSFSWVQLDTMWPDLWRTNEDLGLPTSETYNIACLVNPTICAILSKNHVARGPSDLQFYRDLTFITLMQHPFRWYGYKIKYFSVFWFGDFMSVFSWHDLIKLGKWLLFEGILIFLAGIVTLLWSGMRLSALTAVNQGLFWFTVLFCVFNFALFTFFHYEGRYSLFLRILFIYLPIWNFVFGSRERKIFSNKEFASSAIKIGAQANSQKN